MSLKKLLTGKNSRPVNYGYRGDPHRYSNKLSYEDLVNAESALGRTIFGPIPEGHQREFFEYRKNVWIWHESYVDVDGTMNDMTVWSLYIPLTEITASAYPRNSAPVSPMKILAGFML